MLDAARNIRIFISSPGDLYDERISLRNAINDLRNTNQFDYKYNLIPLLYEDTTPALAGLRPNTLVFDYMCPPEEADVLVCMFWTRFGSVQRILNPNTGRPYGSGTEEEFLTAYYAFKTNGRKPQIMLYRCLRDPLTAPNYDPKQYEQVEAFFARFQDGGDLDGLVRTFTDTEHLVKMFQTELIRVIRKTFEPAAVTQVKLQPSIPRNAEEARVVEFIILADSLRNREAQIIEEMFEKANALYSSTYGVQAEPNVVNKEAAKLATLLSNPNTFIIVLVGNKLFAQELEIYKEYFQRQGYTSQAQVVFLFNRGPRDIYEVDSEHIARVKLLREQVESAGGTFYDYKDERTYREALWYWICKTLESSQIGKLDTGSVPVTQYQDKSKRLPYFFHSVPFPKYYIQREDLRRAVLANIKSGSRENSTPVTVLTGVGGTGKTTFCYELVRDTYECDDHFKGLYWFNFNEVGIERVSTFFDRLSKYIDDSVLPKLWKADPYRCKDSILTELNAASYLIVLDGLESIQVNDPSSPKFGEVEDGLLRDFITGMCESSQSCLVLVSRIAPNNIAQARGVTSFSIAQFKVDEAVKYLEERRIVGSESELNALADHFACHPLSLSIAAEYIVRYYMSEAQRFLQVYVTDVNNPVSEKLGQLLSDYWKHLSTSQQFLLSAIASLHRPLQLHDLEDLAELLAQNSDARTLKQQLRSDLNALVEMSFVLYTASAEESQVYTVHPILKSLITNTLARNDQREEVSTLWALIERMRARSLLENSQAELETRAQEVQYLLDAENYSEAIKIFIFERLNARLFEAGRHDLGIPLGEQIYDLVEKIGIPRPTADYLSGYLPDHYSCVGRITRAVQIMKQLPIDDVWTALVDLVWLLLRGGAYEYAQYVIKNAPERRRAGSAEWVYAIVKYYSGDKECLKHFERTLQDSAHILLSYKVRLRTQFANALIDFNEVERAGSTIDQIPRLVLGTSNSFPAEQTHADLARARIALIRGDHATASSLIQTSIEVARSSGDVYSVLCSLLFRVHLALGIPFDFHLESGHLLEASAEDDLREIQRILRLSSEGELNYGFPIEGIRFHLILALKSVLSSDGKEFDVQVDKAAELLKVCEHHWSRIYIDNVRGTKSALQSIAHSPSGRSRGMRTAGTKSRKRNIAQKGQKK